jgi:hypothetical protein
MTGKTENILGDFSKLGIATIIFSRLSGIPSVRPSVCIEQLSSHYTHFQGI